MTDLTSSTLRPATPEDVLRVAEIGAKAFGLDEAGYELSTTLETYFARRLSDVPLTEQLQEALPREYYIIVLADDDPHIIGMTGIYWGGTWTWPGNLWLGWTAVDPDFQSKGHGSRALKSMMRLAKGRGARALKVETAYGGPAARFYHSHGFTDEARLHRHYGPDLDALVVTRSLDDVRPLTRISDQRRSVEGEGR